MRSLREVSWYQLVGSFKWLRIYGYLPEELKHYNAFGHNKAEFVEIFAYVMEHMSEKQIAQLPSRIEQLYNWIFMDEYYEEDGKHRSGNEPSFKDIVKCDRFGYSEGTQAYLIDMMLLEGRHTTFEIAKAAGSTEMRVRNHINFLRKHFADEVEIITARKGKHCVYYVKEAKKIEKSEGKGKRLNIQTIDHIELGCK